LIKKVLIKGKNKDVAPTVSQLKKLTDLIKKITVDYKCQLNFIHLKCIVKILQYNTDHSLRSNIKLGDVVKYLKFIPGINHNMLFHACAYLILDCRQSKLIEEDEFFTELYKIVSELKVDFFSPRLLLSLFSYCQNLESISTSQIKSNPIVQSLVEINKKAANLKTNKKLASLNRLVFKHFIGLSPELRPEITEHFNNNSILLDVSLVAEKFGVKTIEAERILFNELKSKGKNVNPVLRRLVILECKEAYRHKSVYNATERINKYLEQLPESDVTPLVCDEMIKFHILVTQDIQQANAWYEKLSNKLDGSDFELTKETTLLYGLVIIEFICINKYTVENRLLAMKNCF